MWLKTYWVPADAVWSFGILQVIVCHTGYQKQQWRCSLSRSKKRRQKQLPTFKPLHNDINTPAAKIPTKPARTACTVQSTIKWVRRQLKKHLLEMSLIVAISISIFFAKLISFGILSIRAIVKRSQDQDTIATLIPRLDPTLIRGEERRAKNVRANSGAHTSFTCRLRSVKLFCDWCRNGGTWEFLLKGLVMTCLSFEQHSMVLKIALKIS